MVLKKEINGEEYYCFKKHEYFSVKNTIERFNLFVREKELEQLNDTSLMEENH